uniref:Uncharacterized protein n=1 Tax=Roseihalotalea indica TaxID=2867963 RepID=A0AA49JFK4_9BACT|nr:hypothetical protein K4G66_07885 [Tunicatimonas sp. TK19036]
MLLAAQGLFAQASNKNQRQLHINEKGEVLNDRGTKLGFIKNGKVYDANGNLMGKAKKNGRYYNNNGVLVLKTKNKGDECEILDPKGHKLGIVHKNYKLHACDTHCFFKKETVREEN